MFYTFIYSIVLAAPHVDPVLADGEVTTNIMGQIESGLAKEVFNPQLGVYFSRILEVAIIVAALGSFAMLIMGGIEWITSGGDKAKYESARKRITAAIVGLVLIATAWTLWYLVIRFLNIDTIPQLEIIKK